MQSTPIRVRLLATPAAEYDPAQFNRPVLVRLLVTPAAEYDPAQFNRPEGFLAILLFPCWREPYTTQLNNYVEHLQRLFASAAYLGLKECGCQAERWLECWMLDVIDGWMLSCAESPIFRKLPETSILFWQVLVVSGTVQNLPVPSGTFSGLPAHSEPTV
ncbi:hypothetical protein LXA43DRAFT_1069586 [Ganoderma leucocontextum]|nr:hypothetical protein LXA43DRAFT_1069586 [Ganoderma leucocontextum]